MSSSSASGSASGTVAPRTPILDGEGPISEGVTLFEPCDISRITSVEAENATMKLRMDNLVRFVEEQNRWLQRQSELLTSQRQLLEAMAGEGDAMRDRIRVLEDRVSLLVFAQPNVGGPPSPAPEEDDDDSAPASPQMAHHLTTAEIDEILQGRR